MALFAALFTYSFQSQADCSLSSPQQWQDFVESAANHPKWIETCEDSTCDKSYFDYVRMHVKAPLDSCESVIASNPALKACTENLRKFTPAWLRQHDTTSYGFDSSGANYLNHQEDPDKPAGMMKIPDAIVAALPDQSRVQAVARKNGWKYLTHDSALVGIRTFIYIPDSQQRFDQWMILNLNKSGDKKIAKDMPISILTVQKKTSSGERLNHVRLHFRDYAVEDVEKSVKLSVNLEGNGKCYSCHASGMRQLIPRWTPVLQAEPVAGEVGYNKKSTPAFAYSRLVEFNKIMRQYGPNDWDGKINPDDFGPKLGTQQGCVSCHNGESRGALTVASSLTQIHRKVVKEMSMPPSQDLIRELERWEMKNPPLSATEKASFQDSQRQSEKLAEAFKASRFPELRKWLTEKACL